MTVGVLGGQIWVANGKLLGVDLNVSVLVGGVTIDYEMGRLMDERSGSGIDTSVEDIPEGAAEVDNFEFVGIWSRDLSVTE